jgi:hypothetical protein
MMGAMRPAADSYTYDVGYATASEIRTKAAGVFSVLGYKVVTDDLSRPVYIETQWLTRAPTDAEEKSRGSQLISRISLIGLPTGVAGSPTMYHVLLTIENRYVPSRGTRRDARDASTSANYAQSIVKGMAVAFGGSARPVANEPRPF